MSELKHHGILNMKWGQRNGPPYPLDRSISTGSRLRDKIKRKIVAAGGSIEYRKQKRLLAKAERAKARAERARQKEEAKVKSEEQKKAIGNQIAKQKAIEKNAANATRERVMKHGEPSEVAKYLKTMTVEEMQAVINRFGLEETIRNKIPKEPSKKQKIIDGFNTYANDIKILGEAVGNTKTLFKNYSEFIDVIKKLSKDNEKKNEA